MAGVEGGGWSVQVSKYVRRRCAATCESCPPAAHVLLVPSAHSMPYNLRAHAGGSDRGTAAVSSGGTGCVEWEVEGREARGGV